MELRRYWQIILKRRSTLLKIIGVIVGTVILGSFIISPVYQFSSNVWVKTADPKASMTGLPADLANLGIVSVDLVMYSQLAMIQNLNMIQDIITKMNLEKKKGTLYGAKEFLDPNALDLLINKKGVRVKLVSSTQIIQVSGFSSSPEQAKEIANQVADAFIAMYNQNTKNTGQQALRFIQESIPKVTAELKQAENALAAYKVAHHLSNITFLREKLLTYLTSLKEANDNNETELALIEKRIAQVQAKLKKIPEFEKTTVEYRANNMLEYIRQKLMDAESSMASSAVRVTPAYLAQQQTRASIEKFKDEYRKLAAKIFYSESTGRNPLHTSFIQTLVENEINQALRISRRQLVQQLTLETQKELDELILKELAMVPLNRDVNTIQTTLTNLMTQEQVAKMACVLGFSNAVVIERATLPEVASHLKKFRWFPKRKLLTIFSLLFGLLLGLTTIFFQEYLDDTLSDAGETEESLKLPVLVSLPELAMPETVDVQGVMAHAPWTQAMWALPDMLKPADKESLAGVWAVTSTNAGEGKSLVAASLGWTLALRNHRVLMIDLNFFHPHLPSLWNLPPGVGVCELLQGTASLTDCVRKVGPEELYLLPNGKADEVAWAQLDPKVLAPWLTTMKTGFDVLLLDLPAVGAGEGAPLAALADQILMVVAAHHSPKTQLVRALEQIRRCHGRIEGLVLNRYQQLELWPLLSPAVSALTSWPPVQRLLTFIEKQVDKFKTKKK